MKLNSKIIKKRTDCIKVYCFDTVDSTNTIAKELAANGCDEGVVVCALKQTAGKEGGLDQLIELFTGRQAASSSPVAQLASNIFGSDIAKKLGLSPAIVNAIVPMIPMIIKKFTSSEKIDINELISEAASSGVADKLKEAAGSFLGGLFK